MALEEEIDEAMNGALEHLKKELKSLRTSRANPALLDHVSVEIYGTVMRLRDVANVTVPESRQLLISPYDPKNSPSIAKSIESSDLGLQATVDGNVVRINIPHMDEARRKDMAKQCKEHGERTKVQIREERRKFNNLVRKQKTDGDIPEDTMKVFEKKIQEATDKYCKIADDLCVEKESEILEI